MSDAARDLAEEAFGPTDSEKRRQEARSAAYDHPATATAAREEVEMMEEQLVEALRAIIAVPSEQTLLLNAEARAMYEIAKRALEEVERRG